MTLELLIENIKSRNFKYLHAVTYQDVEQLMPTIGDQNHYLFLYAVWRLIELNIHNSDFMKLHQEPLLNLMYDFEFKHDLILMFHEKRFDDHLNSKRYESCEKMLLYFEKHQITQGIRYAETCYFKAKLYLETDQEHMVETLLYDALDIYDQYAETKIPIIIQRIASTYTLLYRFYSIVQDDKALPMLKQSLDLYAYLKNENDEKSLEQYIRIFVDYVDVLKKANDTNAYREALKLLASEVQHAKDHRASVSKYIGKIFHDYADLIHNDDPEEAIYLYHKAIEARDFSRLSHEPYDIMNAYAYLALSRCYKTVKNYQQALYYCQEAIDLFKKEEKKQAGKYLSMLGLAHHQKAKTYRDAGEDIDVALSLFDALEYYDKASKKEPKYLFDWALIEMELGLYHTSRGELTDAEACLSLACNHFLTYFMKSTRYAHFASIAQFHLIEVKIELRNDTDMDIMLANIKYLYKVLSEQNESKYREPRMKAYLTIANYYFRKKRYDEAIAEYKSALSLALTLAAIDLLNHGDIVISIYDHLIELYLIEDMDDLSMEIRFEQIEFEMTYVKKHSSHEPTFQRHLYVLIALCVEQKEFDIALDLYRLSPFDALPFVHALSIHMIYALLQKNESMYFNHLNQLLSIETYQIKDHGLGISFLILINYSFMASNFSSNWNAHLMQTLFDLLWYLSKHKRFDYETEILLETKTYLIMLFQQTKQLDQLKKIESLDLL